MSANRDKDLIQVFEYDRIYYHKIHNGVQLTEDQFDALVQYNVRNKNKFFTVIHKGLRFRQYVGVIQVGRLTIEILPKADRKDRPDKSKWQQVLYQMLKSCKYLSLENTESAALKTRNMHLMDIFIEQFLKLLEELIHQGLTKQYRSQIENQNAWKGSVQFSKHLSKNLIHKERFYVKHTVYDKKHLLHQILNEALKLIPIITTNPDLMDRVVQLQIQFYKIPNCRIKETDFQNILYTRKTAHYKEAIGLAKLILLNFNPDIQSGQTNVLAILFDMNKLFEDYVFRQLKRQKGVEVQAQNSTPFWNNKTIRPDIVVKIGQLTYVLDTKWKVLTEAKPSDADLKQMYAYQHYWNAEKTFLLYPQVYNLPNEFGLFVKENKECSLAFIPVLNEEGVLNKGLGKDILSVLEGERHNNNKKPEIITNHKT